MTGIGKSAIVFFFIVLGYCLVFAICGIAMWLLYNCTSVLSVFVILIFS